MTMRCCLSGCRALPVAHNALDPEWPQYAFTRLLESAHYLGDILR